jgi:hypothetical protein
MGLGEPSRWVWLRDGTDRLFHAVSVWELPPEEDGPVAVCGRRVQVVSLFDEPDGERCPRAWPPWLIREGTAGNGGGTRLHEGWVRDEQRPDVQYGVGVGVGVAAAAGGGAAY